MPETPTANAADPQQARERKRKDFSRAERDANDLRWVMSDERGRRFTWNMLANCRVFATTFTGEALSAAFNEGARNMGVELLARIMRDCPTLYTAMTNENTGDEKDKG